MNLISLFITSILTENIVLNKFLGICPFVGTSSKEKTALGMGLSVMFVVTLSSIITYLIYYNILVPTNTTYLKTIMFILVISSLVGLIQIILKRFIPSLHKALGIYLPLITTNCAVLGTALLNINNNYKFLEVLVYSIGSSLGFTIVIYIFSNVREYLETRNVLKSLKGYPIAFITASIMALLFTRFSW